VRERGCVVSVYNITEKEVNSPLVIFPKKQKKHTTDHLKNLPKIKIKELSSLNYLLFSGIIKQRNLNCSLTFQKEKAMNIIVKEIDDLRFWLTKVKRIMWNKGLKLWWYRLWIRKDEFHSSLESDRSALMEMSSSERAKYIADLSRRRDIAYKRSLERR